MTATSTRKRSVANARATRARLRAIAITVAAIVLIVTPAKLAFADGDPASDALLGQDVFYPYQPAVSARLQHELLAVTAAAAHAGFPLRIALIDSVFDLGVVPQLFGQPQQYADFLDQEISFLYKHALLVVMPSGYGVQRVSPAVRSAVAKLPKPAGRQSNDLARAALAAVPKLAASAGYPLPRSVTASPSSDSGASSLMLGVLVGLAALVAAALVFVARHRRAHTS
jgi:hypothetical protein